MVFSQMSQKIQNILKVAEIDPLKYEKNQQESHDMSQMSTEVKKESAAISPTATVSFSEEYTKQEPLFENAMLHDMDSEFFQDLVPLFCAPARAGQAMITDSIKTEEDRAHNSDTPNTLFSSQDWESFGANSPTALGYCMTPKDLSPSLNEIDEFNYKFQYNLPAESNLHIQEKFLDINSLSVVIGDLGSEKVEDMKPWHSMGSVDGNNTFIDTTHNTMPFINQEDSADMKFTECVVPSEVEINHRGFIGSEEENSGRHKRRNNLAVDLLSVTQDTWSTQEITTPEVLNYVEQLEKNEALLTFKSESLCSTEENTFSPTDTCAHTTVHVMTSKDYRPPTPQSESHIDSEEEETTSHSRKRRQSNSDDSDESYTPYSERVSTRKYKRKKPTVPLKDMILALEGSPQLTKARRGRPPKRRDSFASSVCSVDDNSSTASRQDNKYRELRDKNNEASKKSRINRKLKELQMEQLAIELEEENKKLRVRAETLEDMTKRLKDAFMQTILNKK